MISLEHSNTTIDFGAGADLVTFSVAALHPPSLVEVATTLWSSATLLSTPVLLVLETIPSSSLLQAFPEAQTWPDLAVTIASVEPLLRVKFHGVSLISLLEASLLLLQV